MELYKTTDCVHFGLEEPPGNGAILTVDGMYKYYHYNCDGFNDTGTC
jgi:hypothetical protein